MAGERKRIGVWLTARERALFALLGEIGGEGDPSAAIRACAVVEARARLARIAPERLSAIDRRFGE